MGCRLAAIGTGTHHVSSSRNPLGERAVDDQVQMHEGCENDFRRITVILRDLRKHDGRWSGPVPPLLMLLAEVNNYLGCVASKPRSLVDRGLSGFSLESGRGCSAAYARSHVRKYPIMVEGTVETSLIRHYQRPE